MSAAISPILTPAAPPGKRSLLEREPPMSAEHETSGSPPSPEPAAGSCAVFLDRDGVLIEDTSYVGRIEDVVPIPGAGRALARLAAAGLRLYVVTNQSGVARGYFTREDVDAIHAWLERDYAPLGVRIEEFLVCACHPDAGCLYRKPSPRFLLETARRDGLDLGRSFLVGDSPSDLAAGRAAGVRTVLVRTGKGRETERAPDVRVDHVAGDLAAAAQWIAARAGAPAPP